MSLSNTEIIEALRYRLEDHEELEERHSALLEDHGRALDTITELRLEVIRLKNGGER